jgi:PAP2 superfamily protein
MAAIAEPRRRLAPVAQALGFRPAAAGTRSWLDLAVFVWLAFIFDAVNNLAPIHQGLAEHHARLVLDLERALHLAPELAINTWLAPHHLLSVIVVFWYDNAHDYVTFLVFGWLWWRRPDILPPLRAALVLLNVAAVALFWALPTAPPRMLTSAGYVDLVASVQGLPVWQGGAIAAHANQLLAMPSLHVAWALWVTIAVWRMCSRPWVRALAVVYPFVTTFAVLATGNHWLADAVAGALVTAVAVLVADRLFGRRRRSTALEPDVPIEEGIRSWRR